MGSCALNKILLTLMMACITFIEGCGSRSVGPVGTSTDLAELSERYNLYRSLSPRDWDLAEGCDSLLFVSLSQVGLGESGPVEEASKSPGQWFRLPAPSYASACSSDISRDMFMGLMTWIHANRRLDLAMDLWNYGRAHGWKMGEERTDRLETRTILTPNLISLLAAIIKDLNGPDFPERQIPAIYDTTPGYTSHLTLLHLNLVGEIRGLSARELDVLQKIRSDMQGNPFVHYLVHRYTDGDQTETLNLLLRLYPANHLPTFGDWAEPWRFQRSDSDPGLLPGDPSDTRPHTGGDFMFLAKLLMSSVDSDAAGGVP